MERCLIIVSRDRLDLLETFASRYREEGDIEIRLDQRRGPEDRKRRDRADRRALAVSPTDLGERGFLVIPRG